MDGLLILALEQNSSNPPLLHRVPSTDIIVDSCSLGTPDVSTSSSAAIVYRLKTFSPSVVSLPALPVADSSTTVAALLLPSDQNCLLSCLSSDDASTSLLLLPFIYF